MGFKDIQNIKLSYNSLSDQIVLDFYIPCLENAVRYKRAVGFFSSNILLQISKGLGAFADHGGRMQLLVSPKLEQADYEAIKKGYDIKDYITNKIVENFDFSAEFDQKEDRFAMLSYMISSGLLDIKIVALEENNDSAMFHKKIGIMEDKSGNYIAFSGSGNETYNGYNQNDEDFEVFCSWTSDENESRCSMKEMEFDRIWKGQAKGLITIPFPQVIKDKLLSFNPSSKEPFSSIDKNFKEKMIHDNAKSKEPKINKNIKFYDYQLDAIETWVNNEYKGIFDMATGTGKTFTGAGALCRLYKDKKRLVTFICCPYTHLVEQWADELKENFNIDPVKCYGSSDYEKQLKREMLKFKQHRSNFLCVIITNSSFQKDSIQDLVKMNLPYTLLLVDEAHNFGATEIRKTMELNYPYRLALSATLERHHDEEGTAKLFNFFGEKCIEYTLARAIEEGKLTPYKYYPILVSLNEDEYDQYVNLSKQVAKYHQKNGELSEQAKKILIRRARLVAGTQSKIDALRNVIKNYENEHNILVYCGAVKYGEYGYSNDEQGKKQIEIILNILNNEMHIYSSKFTAEENIEVRSDIINSFKQQDLQALVAIKCLDEGVNIPAIKTAFILASSTNPKEYVQRRGRVLRKYPGKEYAEIYDFVTLPTDLSDASMGPNAAIDKNLVRKELQRVIDFANLSKNPSDSNELISQIKEAFNMDVILDEEEKYE